MRRDLVDNIPDTDECVLWPGGLSRDGYGRCVIGGRQLAAHRLSYERNVGPIPPGLTVDHMCFTPACYNPRHLRLLSLADNARYSRRYFRDHCQKGHKYTAENTQVRVERQGRSVRRICLTCRAEFERRMAKKKFGRSAEEKAAALAVACPTCNAPPSRWCVTRTTRVRTDALHALRMVQS